MSLVKPTGEEAVRWKKKFLDALEEHEQREKLLASRIRLLRRGLIGVSLAGDGLDEDLDRELTALRASLRAEDSEAGLEHLLERVERSVLRLDTEREQGAGSLQQAVAGSIAQLQNAPVSRHLKQELRQFGKTLATELADSRNHPQLIVNFLHLLRKAVRELSYVDEESAQAPGFWRRWLFGDRPVPPASPSPSPASSPVSSSRAEAAALEEAPQSPVPSLKSAAVALDGQPLDLSTTPAGTAELTAREAEPAPDPQPAEPGFSFISAHVEPLLLRILESITISQQCEPLSRDVRQRVSSGLNWYDFAAALEDIIAIIATSIDQERTDFQAFLTEVNTRLAEVRQFMQVSGEHNDRSAHGEGQLDEVIRQKVDLLQGDLVAADDLGQLQQSVQSQLADILHAVDHFRLQRQEEQARFSSQSRQLAEQIEQLEQQAQELRSHLATQQEAGARDVLTQLPNRAAYDRFLRAQLQAMSQGPGSAPPRLCMAVADVDLFKSVNDTYGHLAGDKVLKMIARAIASTVRPSDFVARYGGEEFVIVMQGLELADAARQMEKVRAAVEEIPFHFKEKQVPISISIGLAAAQPGDVIETLFSRADTALYQAKKDGRNLCRSANYLEA